MKTLIIYVSVHHGNTAKIAETIGEVLGAELTEAEAVDERSLSEYDLIGFGSGIYFGRHHERLLQLVARLPEMRRKAFVFSTRGGGPAWFYHRALKRRLIAKGFGLVGELSVLALDTVGLLRHIGGLNRGRPNDRDLERARAFAADLKRRMEELA